MGWYLSQSQRLIVFRPEHAATIAADGLSRADVQRLLHEHARLPLSGLKVGGMWGIQDWPRWMLSADDRSAAPDRGGQTLARLRPATSRLAPAPAAW